MAIEIVILILGFAALIAWVSVVLLREGVSDVQHRREMDLRREVLETSIWNFERRGDKSSEEAK